MSAKRHPFLNNIGLNFSNSFSLFILSLMRESVSENMRERSINARIIRLCKVFVAVDKRLC